MFPRTPLLLAALSLAACCAGAQTVYRCGSSYSAQPCPGATALDVTDQRPPADAARAGKVASDDWKRAEAMEKARLAQEKNAPRALVIGQKEPPPPEHFPAPQGHHVHRATSRHRHRQPVLRGGRHVGQAGRARFADSSGWGHADIRTSAAGRPSSARPHPEIADHFGIRCRGGGSGVDTACAGSAIALEGVTGV